MRRCRQSAASAINGLMSRLKRTSFEKAIKKAIRRRRSVSAIYDGYVRYFAPQVLGIDGKGRLLTLVYQFAGGFDGGLPEGGAWCCVEVDHLQQARLLDIPWVRGPEETRPAISFRLILADHERGFAARASASRSDAHAGRSFNG
jgi:hypothetical protein